MAPTESTTRRKTNVAARAPSPVRLANAGEDGASALAGSAHSLTATDQPSRLAPASAARLRPMISTPSRTASTSSERNHDFMKWQYYFPRESSAAQVPIVA